MLGTVAFTRRDYSTAERHLNRTVALYQELDVPAGVAAATYNLALIAIARNDMPDARVKLEQSLAVFQGEGLTHAKEVDLIRQTLAKIQGR